LSWPEPRPSGHWWSRHALSRLQDRRSPCRSGMAGCRLRLLSILGTLIRRVSARGGESRPWRYLGSCHTTPCRARRDTVERPGRDPDILQRPLRLEVPERGCPARLHLRRHRCARRAVHRHEPAPRRLRSGHLLRRRGRHHRCRRTGQETRRPGRARTAAGARGGLRAHRRPARPHRRTGPAGLRRYRGPPTWSPHLGGPRIAARFLVNFSARMRPLSRH
jgi:hypothetical protein